jgi:hypothetical protein
MSWPPKSLFELLACCGITNCGCLTAEQLTVFVFSRKILALLSILFLRFFNPLSIFYSKTGAFPNPALRPARPTLRARAGRASS